jgi:8-oxo-dGTP pyrophosphatase MutT (NUDIX family)
VTPPTFRHLCEREVHRGHIWRVVVAEFEAPDGTRFQRDVVRSPGAVGIVPLLFDAEGTPAVVLVRQYRPVLDAELLEIPAGMRDVDGEDPAATAHRELAEEIGFAAGALELLTVFHNSAGMTDATTHVYLGTHLSPVPSAAKGPEEKAMAVVQMPLADAIDGVVGGEITDAKTVIGVLLAGRRLQAGGG